MSTRFRSSVLVAILVSGTTIAQPKSNPAPATDLFSRLSGTWGAKDPSSKFACRANPHTIQWSDDNKVATFTTLLPVELADGTIRNKLVYRVLYAEENRITMLVDDEIRRTDVGDRVVWVLVLVDDETYYWRRTDWPKTGGTSPVGRCKGV